MSSNRFIAVLAVAIIATGSSSLVVSTAQAQWYMSANAGGTILKDSDFTETFTGGSAAGDVDFHTGFGITEAVGYSWGAFRLEGEVSYRENDLGDFTVTSLSGPGGTLVGSTGLLSFSGDISALGFMANGWYDFDTGSRWVPFVGGGIGIAIVNLNVESVLGVPVTYDESDTVFAYQGGAGLGYRVNSSSTISLSYRLFGTSSDPEFNDGVEKIKLEYMSHNIMAGILIKF